MASLFKNIYKALRSFYHKMKFYYSVNWTKTLYFNFKKFPFKIAKKLPVFFYGKIKLHDLSGQICIDAPIKTGMIGFGQPFELFRKELGIAEFSLSGRLVCKGNVHFGKDCLIFIGPNSYCEIGDMFALGSRGKLFCLLKVVFGKYVRIGFESQIMDTNSHQIINIETGIKEPKVLPIQIGNYNWVGNRTSIMPNSLTLDFCIVASNSLCNKDYSGFGKNILIGGIPAKHLKSNVSRDWEGEDEQLRKIMNVK